ncbi:hypothetical protein C8F01DRAFT_1084934 [Mycena amicta]|nr:hypothetical protein C8F01DRAFT_1084934 [Mycena amicta]
MFPKDSLLKMAEDGNALSSASEFLLIQPQMRPKPKTALASHPCMVRLGLPLIGHASTRPLPTTDTTIVTAAESGSVDVAASVDNTSVDNASQTTTEGQPLSSSVTVTVLLDGAAAAADVPVVQSIDNDPAATETIGTSPSDSIASSPQGPIPSTQNVSAAVSSSLIRRTTGSQGALVSFLPGGGRNSTLATLAYTGDRSLVVNPELLARVVSAVAVAVSNVQNGGGDCPGCGAPHA